jgi:hypothetical protein
MLPDRSTDAEDAFVTGLYDADSDTLVAAVTDAIAAGRPRLAARLVGLIDAAVSAPDGSPLDRARRAAALLLLPRARSDGPDRVFDDLTQAWSEFRRRRLERVRRRAREALRGPGGRGPRSGRRR